jgi:tetratricopeptide (TPR) repeat protein
MTTGCDTPLAAAAEKRRLDKLSAVSEPCSVQLKHRTTLVHPSRWLLVLSLALPMGLPAPTVLAGPPPPPPPPEGEGDDPQREAREQNLDMARELHGQAQTRYEMFDYEGAIEAWMEAYRMLRNDESATSIRNAIVFNIATARLKAYEVDKDVQHLQQAVLLLRKYLKDYTNLNADAENMDEETEKIRQKLEELNAMISAVEPEEEETPDAPFPANQGPSTPLGPPGKKDKKISGLTYGGIAGIALGLGGLGLMGYGMSRASTWQSRYEDFPDDRGQIADEGNTANTMSVIGGAVGGVFLAAGVTLVVLDQVFRKQKKGPWGDPADKAKKKDAKDKAKKKTSMLVPVASPSGTGVLWTVSF